MQIFNCSSKIPIATGGVQYHNAPLITFPNPFARELEYGDHPQRYGGPFGKTR